MQSDGSGDIEGGGSLPAKPALSGGPQAPGAGMALLERITMLVAERGGSDIHMLEGERARVRLRGDLIPLESKEHPVVTRADIEDVLARALTPDQRRVFEESSDIDFSLDFPGASGRVNVGMANGRRLHLVMRYLRTDVIPIDAIGIDAAMLRALADGEGGVVIVAGETSSGKTTTIAAMLDHINHTRAGSIQTIENPVEYHIPPDRCMITRREIGRDTPDFATALRASVRKNPDVLLIGEVRDRESANIAITAAETGIHTFCTLHAMGSVPAITRLRNMMSAGGAGDMAEFHGRLAQCLRGIVSQRLMKATDGGIVPIFEILNMEYTERNYLRDGDFARLEQCLESDHNVSTGHCVYRLWHAEPRRIDEAMVRLVFGDRYHLMMNRLADPVTWHPLVTGL